MSYLVLARKFRPQTFREVSGQEHVTRTIANSIRRNRIAHAYLFAGPRGVGKTSIARILAKSLNCKDGPTAEPCGKCTSCKEIAQGTSLAVREIDGASHNSVDNVRELIDTFRSLPPPGSRYKVYIIDEVHMLSISAFNALLKSLEEPPPNTLFILATTDPQKIPETVISRCQRHDLRALSSADIEERLLQICKEENIEAEPEAIRMLVRLSDGGMRDAQSLLERVRAFCDDKITAEDTGRVLGTVERAVLFELSGAILSGDPASALSVIDKVFSTGIDAGLFLKDFVTHFRELLIGKFGGGPALSSSGISKDQASEVLDSVKEVATRDMQDLVHIAREGADSAIRSAWPRYVLESLVVRMATREPVAELAAILAKMSGSAGGAGSARATAAPGSPASVASGPAAKSAHREAPSKAGVETKGKPVSFPDWSVIVAKVSEAGARMLGEQLKRIVVKRFEPGILEASGSAGAASYIQDSDNLKKFKSVLSAQTGVAEWTVKIESGAGAGTEGSLMDQEKAQMEKSQMEAKESILSHPKLKSIQKAFPGSKIENIKLRETNK